MKLLLANNPGAPKLTLLPGGVFAVLKPDHDGKFRLTDAEREVVYGPVDGRCRCGCWVR